MSPASHPKPVLLLDVDGPLNPYRLITNRGHLEPKVRPGERRYSYERHEMRPDGWIGAAPCPVLISREHGGALNRLAEVFTLVWATTWEESANALLVPLLGMAKLPVIEWPPAARAWTAREPRHPGCWKTKHIAAWLDDYAVYRDQAGDLQRIPWVWVDDEITRADRDWFHRHYNDARGQADRLVVDRWLLTVHPKHGLREFDFEALYAWGLRHQSAHG